MNIITSANETHQDVNVQRAYSLVDFHDQDQEVVHLTFLLQKNNFEKGDGGSE